MDSSTKKKLLDAEAIARYDPFSSHNNIRVTATYEDGSGEGELIVTRDLRDRMAVMAENSDAFVIATGGLGTLYELFEVLTLNQLRYVDKPVVLLNVNGYYDRLLDQFEVMYESRCAREKCRQMYFVAASAQEAIDHILAWQPKALSGWMTDVPEGQVK